MLNDMFDLTVNEAPFFLKFLIGCEQILFEIEINITAWEVFDLDWSVFLNKCLIRWVFNALEGIFHFNRCFLLLNWSRLLLLLFDARKVVARYLCKLEQLLWGHLLGASIC